MINVCISTDENYSKYAGVVVASILASADKSDELTFYILDGGISDLRKKEIQSLKSIKDCTINFVPINVKLFDDYKDLKTHEYLSIAAYYRLKVASLLPEVSRIIYFDCDVVVNSSLKEIFETDLSVYPVAGVLDINKRMLKKNPSYVNSGMLVMNLDLIREQNVEDSFLFWAKKHFDTIKMGDQEIINEVLKGRIKILPDEWNVQSSNFTNRSSYTKTPKIIHYVKYSKPWVFGTYSYHKKYWFKYLQLTPWALVEGEKRHWYFDNQIVSLIKYVCYRPLFLFRPRFYKAIYYTYGIDDLLKNIFSITDYSETHNILKICGIKIKFPKKKFANKKKQSPFYYYKENNIDITTVPKAEGQLREIQLANLRLLKELDYVCKTAGLTYWLDGGTLLGAVRHKGFIPWDDDIDVAMRRKDYEKLIETFNNTTRDKDIFAGYVRGELNPCQVMIKIQHKKCPYLFVDVFPWDDYGKRLTTEEQLEETNKIKGYRKELQNSSDKSMSDEVILDKIHTKMKECVLTNEVVNDNEGMDFVWGMDFNHIWKNWFTHWEVLYPLKTIEFEGIEFPCLNNPDAFLSRLYGNYMAYPKKITFGHAAFLDLSAEDKEVIKQLGAEE